jgi:hypothetical protein
VKCVPCLVCRVVGVGQCGRCGVRSTSAGVVLFWDCCAATAVLGLLLWHRVEPRPTVGAQQL